MISESFSGYVVIAVVSASDGVTFLYEFPNTEKNDREGALEIERRVRWRTGQGVRWGPERNQWRGL